MDDQEHRTMDDPLRRCDKCDNPMRTWHTVTIGAVDFRLCQRCDLATMHNGSALAALYRKELERAQSKIATLRRRTEQLQQLVTDVFTEEMHMNHEASHPTCNSCGHSWGHRVERIGSGWRQYVIEEQHGDGCWAVRARAALKEQSND